MTVFSMRQKELLITNPPPHRGRRRPFYALLWWARTWWWGDGDPIPPDPDQSYIDALPPPLLFGPTGEPLRAGAIDYAGVLGRRL